MSVSCSTRPNKLYCGSNYCDKTANGSSKRDKDKSDLAACPNDKYGAEYINDGYYKYKKSWPLADVYRRRCKKKILQGKNWETDCALGKQDSKYCPDGWCGIKSANAINHMEKLCRESKDVFGNPYCEKWYELLPKKKEIAYKKHCNKLDNIGNPKCRSYCKNNPGMCDKIRDWCQINPKDPLCSCYKSPLNDLGRASPPASCFDSTCKNSGYMTKSMYNISNNCPDYIDCKQLVNISSGAVMNDVSVKQNCSIAKMKKLRNPGPTPEEIAAKKAKEEAAKAAERAAAAKRIAAAKALKEADAKKKQLALTKANAANAAALAAANAAAELSAQKAKAELAAAEKVLEKAKNDTENVVNTPASNAVPVVASDPNTAPVANGGDSTEDAEDAEDAEGIDKVSKILLKYMGDNGKTSGVDNNIIAVLGFIIILFILISSNDGSPQYPQYSQYPQYPQYPQY